MKGEGEGREGNEKVFSPSRAVLSNVVVSNWCNSTSS